MQQPLYKLELELRLPCKL